MFNAAFLSAPVTLEANLFRRLALPQTHFRARGLEWAYWVCQDFLETPARRRWRRIFEQHGLRHSVDLPGMVADRIVPPARPLPHISVRRVSDAATKDAFCDISSECFRVPILWFREVFDGPSVWERFAAYVGYVNGRAVSTAATVPSGDTVGVYNVATTPEFRRRGYGEAVMRFALDDTRKRLGLERSALQSTPAGLRIYERMGYRTVTSISVWAS